MSLGENNVLGSVINRSELAVDENVTWFFIKSWHWSIFTKVLFLFPKNSWSWDTIWLHSEESPVSFFLHPVSYGIIFINFTESNKVWIYIFYLLLHQLPPEFPIQELRRHPIKILRQLISQYIPMQKLYRFLRIWYLFCSIFILLSVPCPLNHLWVLWSRSRPIYTIPIIEPLQLIDFKVFTDISLV